MSINLILIASVLVPPNTPFSYKKIRSVFSTEQRFEQLKKTIESIKKKIPNNFILVVECSNLIEKYETYLKKNVHDFINLIDDNESKNKIYGPYKGLGESQQIIKGIEYIKNKYSTINFKSLYKIAGRYWLSDNFNYNSFDNEKIIIKKIRNNNNNIFTCFYKIPYEIIDDYIKFWISKESSLTQKGIEVVFSEFVNINNANMIHKNPIGIEGYVSVSGEHYYG